MAFRDIWNLIITGDTSEVDRKVKGLGKTAEETGATVETTFRGRMSSALGSFAQKIPGASGLMEKFGVTSSQAGALMGTAVAGGAAAAGIAVEKFISASITEFTQQAEAVLHFKEVTGLAADEASRFVAIADDYAVSAEDLSAAVGKLDKTAGTTPANLTKLGVEIAKNKDGAYDAGQTFLNVVDAYNATDDASRKAAIAQGAFGKQWQGLVKLLDVGSGQIKSSLDSVQDFQLFSEDDLKSAENWRHSMDDLNDAVKGFEKEIGQALVPLLAGVADVLVRVAEKAHKNEGPLGLLERGFKLVADAAGTVVAPAVGAAQALGLLTDASDDTAGALDDAAFSADKAKAKTTAYALEVKNAMDANLEYASNRGYEQALNDQREALEKVTVATENFRLAQRKLRDDQLGLQGAIYSSLDSLDAYREKVADATSTSREQEQANIAVQQSFADVAQKAIDTAAQQAALHGATLTATGAINAQLSALREVGAELGPEDGKVRAELDLYMLALFNIPGQIVTNVDLQGTGVAVLGRSTIGNRREGSGGQGSATSGADYVAGIKDYEAKNGTGWRQ